MAYSCCHVTYVTVKESIQKESGAMRGARVSIPETLQSFNVRCAGGLNFLFSSNGNAKCPRRKWNLSIVRFSGIVKGEFWREVGRFEELKVSIIINFSP